MMAATLKIISMKLSILQNVCKIQKKIKKQQKFLSFLAALSLKSYPASSFSASAEKEEEGRPVSAMPWHELAPAMQILEEDYVQDDKS